VSVVLVSLAPAGTRTHGRRRGQSRWLHGWWRGGQNRRRRRGRWLGLRSRPGLHASVPARVSSVATGYRLRPHARRCRRLNGRTRRCDARDQSRAAGAASASAPVAGRPRYDADRAGYRLDQQQRVKRPLRQVEAKGRRRSREDLLQVTRLERGAPEVTRRRCSSHERRQPKCLSGDDHAASMRLRPDGG
jgi:hypothetical protein